MSNLPLSHALAGLRQRHHLHSVLKEGVGYASVPCEMVAPRHEKEPPAVCTCGADAFNATLDRLIEQAKEMEKEFEVRGHTFQSTVARLQSERDALQARVEGLEYEMKQAEYLVDVMRAENKYPGKSRLYSRLHQLLEAERTLRTIMDVIHPPAHIAPTGQEGAG